MRLEALLLDVDGTLADTERHGHRVAFNQAFQEAGLDWHWDANRYGELLAITGGKERIRHFVETDRPAWPDPDDPAAFIAELHRSKTRHYVALLEQGGIPLRPGVERLLNEARRAGVRLAIATTTTPENVTTLLTHTLGPDSVDWFEVLAAGDVVPAKKPAPDIYTYTLERMGLPPQGCLALEDSANGLTSARAAGVPTVVTVNDYTREQDFSGAMAVLDHLGDPGCDANRLDGPGGPVAYVDIPYLEGLLSQANRRPGSH
jgi:HAD superfamily hydrolase (TIGR01509 family)